VVVPVEPPLLVLPATDPLVDAALLVNCPVVLPLELVPSLAPLELVLALVELEAAALLTP
jgi:hypothetical protein